jgi:predicted RNase H-like HicB family nuclease
MRYTVLLDWDAEGGGYVVSVPALPGCITQGPTVAIATERAREAIEGHVAALAKLGEPVPVEDPPLIAVAVDVDAAAGTMAAAD